MSVYFNTHEPLLQQLDDSGYEFDQMMRTALDLAASNPDVEPEDSGFPDSYLLVAAYRLNTVLTELVNLDDIRLNLFHDYSLAPKCAATEVIPGQRLCNVLNRAVLSAKKNTIGVGDFLKAVVRISIDDEPWDAIGFPGQVIHETFSIETLMCGLGYTPWTPIEDAPRVRNILDALDGRDPREDLDYFLTLENNRIVFRATTPLGSFTQQRESGLLVPQHAALTHFQSQFGTFTPAEVLELEDLINNTRTQEQQLQSFFESHPHFLRIWDHREVFPHVYLSREEEGSLVPDFILLDRDAQAAMILDLKLPRAKLIVHQDNRVRFAAAISEAKAQLLEYRRWFEESRNRKSLKQTVGMEIYNPRLAVVIGRSSCFAGEYERQKLAHDNRDLEIVTYDDILTRAKRRLMTIQSDS